MASELESDTWDTVDWDRKWLVDFIVEKTQLISFHPFNNIGAIDVIMDSSVFEEKSPFKMLGLNFFSNLEWGSYIISIAKTVSKKIGALIRSMKFLFREVTLFLSKSTICPCTEYWCQVWAGAPVCYLELLGRLQICRIVGPSLEHLNHCWNVSSLRIHWSLSTILKTMRKVYEVMFFDM